MTTGKSSLVTIAVELKHETEKAYLLSDGEREVWIPKAQCQLEEVGENLWDLELEERLAKSKELI